MMFKSNYLKIYKIVNLIKKKFKNGSKIVNNKKVYNNKIS